MRVVLDTNEYILALGPNPNPESKTLLNTIVAASSRLEVFLPVIIFKELRRNCHPKLFQKILKTIRPIVQFKNDNEIPFLLGAKYESFGLKPADSLISAFCEFFEINLPISENRHFLSRRSDLAFKVVTAAAGIELLKA